MEVKTFSAVALYHLIGQHCSSVLYGYLMYLFICNVFPLHARI